MTLLEKQVLCLGDKNINIVYRIQNQFPYESSIGDKFVSETVIAGDAFWVSPVRQSVRTGLTQHEMECELFR